MLSLPTLKFSGKAYSLVHKDSQTGVQTTLEVIYSPTGNIPSTLVAGPDELITVHSDVSPKKAESLATEAGLSKEQTYTAWSA